MDIDRKWIVVFHKLSITISVSKKRIRSFGKEKVDMKKRLILLGLLAMIGLTGCNKQIVDFTYSYEKAILQLPDGTIVEGEDQW